MPVQANASGVVTGKFMIPSGIRAGSKLVELTGAAGSKGQSVFTGQGTIETVTRQNVRTQRVHNFIRRPIDPIAQTFSLPEKAQISGVDLWFCAKGPTKVLCQIRETEVGFPTQTVLAEAVISSADITVGAFNRVEFPWPVTLLGDHEYCLVVLCDDAISSCGVAELGKWDLTNQAWVTSQPYQIGVLLSSSNAVTWTAHQDRDLTFKLLRHSYTETTRTINLGVVPVVDATDLVVAGAEVIPDESTRVEYRLTLPNTSQVMVSSGQALKLTAAITGDVQIEAVLHGVERFSPILFPDTQLLWGAQLATGTYITRAMLAGVNSRVRVIFDALIPSGSTVAVAVSGVDVGDTWAAVPQLGSAVPLDNGWHEFTYEAPDVDENMVRVKLTLAGTPAARPQVANLRVMVM